jgi:hypothetical protein
LRLPEKWVAHVQPVSGMSYPADLPREASVAATSTGVGLLIAAKALDRIVLRLRSHEGIMCRQSPNRISTGHWILGTETSFVHAGREDARFFD